MISLQFSSKLQSISSRSDLIKKIREQLTSSFEDLGAIKGSIPLIIELCIAIESMSVQLKGGKKELFFDVYSATFGNVTEVDRMFLSEIVDYLVESGAVYKRTRLSRVVRAIASCFRS